MEQVSGFYFPPSGQTSSGFSEMEEISVGGFNILIRAKRDGKWWVLKALAPDVRHNEVFRSLLHKEYDILSKIQHPGVVYVEGIEEVDGYGECLVQEWIDGVTLDEWLSTPHTRSQRRQVAHQLLEVMEYVHSQQVVHRDLKLSNIMVTRSGCVVKVIDFGLSDADYYVILKSPAGTEGYISPEQQRGGPTDVRNDIYSLGIILDKLQLGLSCRLSIGRCLCPLEARYPNVAALRHHILFLHRSLMAFWIVLGLLLVGIAGGAIYNKVNQPDTIYDVVSQFKVGNFLCTSWGGGVVSVKAINQKDSCIEVPKTVTYQGMTYKVDEIEKNAFARHAVLKWLVFPDTRFHVMRGMITGSPHIQSICFRSVEPPFIGNAIWKTKITDVFEAPCFEKVKLMVPKGSLDAYRKSPWGKFRHIEEYE